ncbi:tripartite tricarboxylate transporter substrate binding protein [Seohaeicola zhoushanensis]|uniref:Tripartite tricarboxylate transporter substrate binding protein n=1 Tax=Seohaeicola zhoushanensis TaxID=1569283 RepID=A0A8J3H2D3_9RHOB|nr:tripartite tricarboxylate transporter substrate binding protein [Seohaeicola zhoushanensis]GHF70674.1 hypothetical protein GCM10017056_47060 [Seohaeicola zhoushanensis]
MTLKRRALLALAVAATGLAALPALAQDYPNKPITMLVGYNAGGQTDLVARGAAQVLSQELGQPINVVNVPGAGGVVSAKKLQESPNDGYTIMFHANSVVNSAPFLMKRVDFKPDDFEWGGFITAYQGGLVAPADAPYNDLAEFVAWAKENPNFAYGALSPEARMYMNEIAKKNDLKANIVPLNSGGEMINAILGHQVVMALSGGIHAKYPDQIKMLATLTTFRHSNAPEVKSIDDFGYSLAMDTRAGIMAPKGTDPAIMAKLSAALAKCETDESFQKIVAAANIPIIYMDAAAAKAEMEATFAKNGEIYKSAGVEPQ